MCALLFLTGCPTPPRPNVPANDTTPPSAMWLQAIAPGKPMVSVQLGSAPATLDLLGTDTVAISASADDPDGGVKAIRIWMTTIRGMPGQILGPTLGGAPEAQTTSSATVGQPADVNLRAAFNLDVPTLLGSFHDVGAQVFAEAENHSGGVSRTAVLTVRYHAIPLRLHVIPLSDVGGGRSATVTRAQFATVVDRVNRVYRGTALRFVFDSINGWAPRPDTILNRDAANMRTRGNALADSLPGRIVLLLRFGSGAAATGNGNAFPPPGAATRPPSVTDQDQHYVALPNFFASGSGLDQGNGGFVAHELGHYLGLYHTFPGWWDHPGPVYPAAATTQADLDTALVRYIRANGDTIDALDGDAISDTPPDPARALFTIHRADICTSNAITVTSYTFRPDITNVMSYHDYTGCGLAGTFTPLQIQRMRQTLGHASRSHLVP